MFSSLREVWPSLAYTHVRHSLEKCFLCKFPYFKILSILHFPVTPSVSSSVSCSCSGFMPLPSIPPSVFCFILLIDVPLFLSRHSRRFFDVFQNVLLYRATAGSPHSVRDTGLAKGWDQHHVVIKSMWLFKKKKKCNCLSLKCFLLLIH